jgi:hypothetical protein
VAAGPIEGSLEDMRGYDAHPSMFAPSGRIPQVEYAREVWRERRREGVRNGGKRWRGPKRGLVLVE